MFVYIINWSNCLVRCDIGTSVIGGYVDTRTNTQPISMNTNKNTTTTTARARCVVLCYASASMHKYSFGLPLQCIHPTTQLMRENVKTIEMCANARKQLNSIDRY